MARGRRRKQKAHPVDLVIEDLRGSGWFSDKFNQVKNSVKDFFGLKLDYTNSAKKILSEYGGDQVVSIKLSRAPVQSALIKLFDLISNGKFSQAKNEEGYDKMFHLSMLCTVQHNGQLKEIRVEKNEVINITPDIKHSANTELIDVSMNGHQFTLREMVDRTQRLMGDNDYFTYSFGHLNCQNYIMNILKANDIWTPALQSWLFQDVSELLKKLPESTRWTAKMLTDVGAFFSKITGKGVRPPYTPEQLAEFAEKRKKYDAIRQKQIEYNQKVRLPAIEAWQKKMEKRSTIINELMPELQNVRCTITEDLKPGNSTCSKGECEERHRLYEEKLERERLANRSGFDKFGDNALSGIVNGLDAVSTFLPAPLAAAVDVATSLEGVRDYKAAGLTQKEVNRRYNELLRQKYRADKSRKS